MSLSYQTHLHSKMTAAIIAIVMVAAFPAVSFGAEAGAQNQDVPLPVDLSDMTEETAVEGELLVLAKDDATRKELREITEDAGASLDRVTTVNDGEKLAKISIDDPDDAQAVADEIVAEDEIILVQPNYIYRLNEDEDQAGVETGEEPPEKETVTSEDAEISRATQIEQAPQVNEAAEADDVAKAKDVRIQVDERIIDDRIITQWYTGSGHAGSTRAAEAWQNLNQSDDQATVAVIDTGVRLDHPELEDNIIADKCITFNNGKKMTFTEGDGSDDDDGHGTHVCGIIASNAGDDFGISGIADNRAKLIVIDAALPGDLDFTTEDVVLGISYAVNNGADVINMSIGALYRDFIMEESISRAFNNNVLCVCAAGNDRSELTEAPGDSPGAISVIAHNEKGNKASFSNYGYEKDVSAPGVDIVSSYISTKDDPSTVIYKSMSGTSMASPVVAGMAALIKSENPNLNARELKNLIYTSSGGKSFSTNAGFGKVNAISAVNNVHSTSKPEQIVLNRTQKKMYTGESLTLEYVVYPGTASVYADDVAFESSNSKVAKVDASGRITAVKSGSATITARCDSVSAKCSITVENIKYATISKLPYKTSGYFSPDDPTVRINYKKESWEAMADGYETPQIKADKKMRIIVYSRLTIPFVKVYDPSGRELTNLTQIVSGETMVTADFTTKAAGKYRILVTGANFGSSVVKKSYDLTIKDPAEPDRVANTIAVKAKTAKVKYSKLKKKNQTLSRAKVMTLNSAKGKVTYTKLAGNKKISINKTNGKVTVKKKLKKGTYKVLVRVRAAGDAYYEAANRYVTLTIKVR